MTDKEKSFKNILLVEDEVLIAMHEKKQLENIGYQVRYVSNGEMAIDSALDPKNETDLILMDIDLGKGMDGTEAAAKILEKNILPIVFLSSHTEPELVEKTEKITSYGYVVKNSGITVLDASIKMAFKLFEAKEKAEQSREKYQELADSITDLFYAMDNELNLTFWNKAIENLSGIPPKDALGKNIYDIFPDKNHIKKSMDFYNHVIKTQKPQSIISETFLFGKKYFFELSAYPAVNGLSVFVKDITERMLAEEKLQKSEELLKAQFENSPDLIMVLDCNLRYVTINKILFGNTPVKELIGRNAIESLPGQIQEVTRSKIEQCFRTGEKQDFEHEVGNGQWARARVVPLPSKDGIKNVMIISSDITANKHTEIELMESEIKFKNLFMSMNEGFYLSEVIYDDEGNPCDYRYLEVNPKFEIMLGLSRDQIIGKRYKEIVPVDTSRWLENYFQVARTGESRTFEFYSPEFKMYFMTYSYRPVKNQISVFVIDVTERRLVEEKVRQQLAEKEIFIKEVHHRIKNNIATIENLLKLHASSTENTEAQNVLNDAIRRVDSMLLIYDKVLRSKDYNEASLKNYLEELITLIMNIFPEKNRIKINKKIDDFQIEVKMLFPVGTIVNELISNSMKYAFEGRSSGVIEIMLIKNKNEITLSVQDNGKGLPDNFNIDESTGFGLMLVKMLTQQINGSLSIENHHGAKTVIKFEL